MSCDEKWPPLPFQQTPLLRHASRMEYGNVPVFTMSIQNLQVSN